MKDLNIKNLLIISILNILFSAGFVFFVNKRNFLIDTTLILYFVILVFVFLITMIEYLIIYSGYKKLFKKFNEKINKLISGKIENSKDEPEGADIITLSVSLNELKNKLSSIINQIELSVLDINGNASTLSMFSDSLIQRINLEKENIGKITGNMDKLKNISMSIKTFTDEALKISSENKMKIDLSIKAVKNLIDAMNEISENSSSIVEIAEFIANVADETNLLALNASIEASRAGSEGAGFSIVASEIRELAENSASAIKSITSTIENIVKSVKKGVQYSNNAKTALTFIVQGIEQITSKIEEINKKLINQTEITQSIHDEVSDINRLIGENNQLLIEMIKSIKNLSKQSEILKEIISQFEYSSDQQDMTKNIFGVETEEPSDESGIIEKKDSSKI